MKKILAIVLCLILLMSNAALFASAKEEAENVPVIYVPGFMQCYMFIEEEGKEDYYLWLPHKEAIFQRIIDDMPNFLKSIAGLIFKSDFETFGQTMGGGAYAVAEKMSCNPDGSPMYNTSHYINDPAVSNSEYLKDTTGLDKDRKNFLFNDFSFYLDENGYTDLKDTFIFEYDFRMDPITIAEELRTFIKDVKDYTNSEKVNLYTVSYGGLIAAAYLYSYMDEGDINRAVLNVPPLQGTDFPDRLFRKNVNLPLGSLLDLVESVLCLETDIGVAIENLNTSSLDEMMDGASTSLLDVVKNWGSIYALTAPQYYDGMKRDFLDPVANKAVIEKNDMIHYEIMPKMKELFEECDEKGIEVAIISCTDSKICLGGDLNGDVLVPTFSSSGATVAPIGNRFSDGYKAVGTTCSSTGHNHISPAMTVDASSAYLPERTWFVDGSFHAMFEKEEYLMALSAKLLFTNELETVHSDPNFPQFETSYNPHRGIHAKFNKSLSGYLSKEDTALVIENIYASSPIIITGIEMKGTDLSFKLPAKKLLMPGEKIEVPFSGKIPEGSAIRRDVEISYKKALGSIVFTLPITVNNGAAPEYNGSLTEVNEAPLLQPSLTKLLYKLVAFLGLEKAFKNLLSGASL